MKKIYLFYVFLGFVCLFFACSQHKNHPKYADILEETYSNKLFASFDSVAFDSVFKVNYQKVIAHNQFKDDIEKFYVQHHFEPVLVQQWVVNGQVNELLDSIQTIEKHGFSEQSFHQKELNTYLNQLNQHQFSDINELYTCLVHLELYLASSVLNYHNYLKYGCVNPYKVMSRFRIPIQKATTTSNLDLLNNVQLHSVLQNAQPKNPEYWLLQKAFLEQKNKGNKALAHKLLINMERLRWQIPKLETERVEVNIPTFKLDWINGDSVLTQMKVCVGEKMESNYTEKMKKYLETNDLNLKPNYRETSILISSVRTVQVNPVWNIPTSIAKREIYNHVLRNRGYLRSHNIKVYKHGKLVNSPDTIHWGNYSQDKLPYTFKQAPGDDNALGKFKFIFTNNDGLYLHDTNVKSAFNRSNRAVSHGCVRLQDPLKFAELLSGSPKMYDRWRVAVNLKPLDTTQNAIKMYENHQKVKTDTLKKFVLRPATYKAGNPVQLYIKYQTVFVSAGEIHYAPDVYELDAKIWNVLRNYITL